MNFLGNFTLHVNSEILFSLTLLLGLLGGEIARFTRFLPRISGYIAIGFLIGPCALNIATPSLIVYANFFVDIALGLVLFELGRHLNFNWLRNDRGLLPMAIMESFLTFSFIFILLYSTKFSWLMSALVATIAIATSPSVAIMTTNDIASEGPITRRTLALTSLNNLLACVLFSILLLIAHIKSSLIGSLSWFIAYQLICSVILGFIMFFLTVVFSNLIGKNKKNHLVLLVGIVILSVGLCISCNLSIMLTLFILGISVRNFDKRHRLSEVNFVWISRVFLIPLFVLTGINLNFDGLMNTTIIVIVFILLKIVSKSLGVLIFSKASHLTKTQCISLGFTLIPMAELTIGMSNKLVYVNPGFNYQLIAIVSAVVSIFYILGPIAVQIALIKSGETAHKVY